MQVATGKSILGGIAIGPLRIYKKAEAQTSQTSALTPAEKWDRFQSACAKAKEQLAGLYDKALNEVGEDNAAIFEIHQMRTIWMPSPWTISPLSWWLTICPPSETVQLDKSKLLGFITRHGSSNSHTAILARTMNIPALIGVDFDDSWDGKLAVLDGYNHFVYIEPAQELLTAMEEKRKGDLKQEALLQGLKKKPNVTLDGKEIKVYANIGNAGDVGLVLQNDAQGIGLFRSEFIYLDSQDYPTEDQQFMLYKRGGNHDREEGHYPHSGHRSG